MKEKSNLDITVGDAGPLQLRWVHEGGGLYCGVTVIVAPFLNRPLPAASERRALVLANMGIVTLPALVSRAIDKARWDWQQRARQIAEVHGLREPVFRTYPNRWVSFLPKHSSEYVGYLAREYCLRCANCGDAWEYHARTHCLFDVTRWSSAAPGHLDELRRVEAFVLKAPLDAEDVSAGIERHLINEIDDYWSRRKEWLDR